MKTKPLSLAIDGDPTPIACVVDTSLLNDPSRLRERADAIEAWESGRPVDKFCDGEWIQIEEQTAFFFDRRYRARPTTPTTP